MCLTIDKAYKLNTLQAQAIAFQKDVEVITSILKTTNFLKSVIVDQVNKQTLITLKMYLSSWSLTFLFLEGFLFLLVRVFFPINVYIFLIFSIFF